MPKTSFLQSYYNLSFLSVCLFGISSVVFQWILTKSHTGNLLGTEGDLAKTEFEDVCVSIISTYVKEPLWLEAILHYQFGRGRVSVEPHWQ